MSRRVAGEGAAEVPGQRRWPSWSARVKRWRSDDQTFDQDQWLQAATVEAEHQAIAAAWDRVELDVCESLGEAQNVDRRPKAVPADNGLREDLLGTQR